MMIGEPTQSNIPRKEGQRERVRGSEAGVQSDTHPDIEALKAKY
jgi:hypothetical protein